MSTIKSRGIIIKRRNFGEADRILTIVTPGLGKITAIAKSVRRIKSRLGGHLELFYCVDFLLAQGKTWYVVAGAQIVESFPLLHKNLILFESASSMARLMDKTIQEGESFPYLYRRLIETLKYFEKNPKLLVCYFSWKLLDDLGYWPELKICTMCSKSIDSKQTPLYFSNSGLICSVCKKNGITLSSNCVKLIRLFKNIVPSTLVKIKIDKAIEEELEKVTKMYWEYYLESE